MDIALIFILLLSFWVCFDIIPLKFGKTYSVIRLNEIVAAVPKCDTFQLSVRRLLEIIFTYLSGIHLQFCN